MLLVVNVLLFAAIVVLFSFQFFGSSKHEIVYVDNVKLLNGFNMSKDLQKINTSKVTAQKKELDSLFNVYSIFREQKNEEKVKELEQILRIRDKEFRTMAEELSNSTNQKIWKRLNQYVKEYGELNDYKIVLGTQGSGNVMYAEENADITEAILIYANDKYEGN